MEALKISEIAQIEQKIKKREKIEKLRDMFAGQAMNGLLSDTSDRGIGYITKRSYEIADAMIEERKKGESNGD